MPSNLLKERQEMAKFISTKTYNQIGPVAYRQWRADSHCNLVHGYALSFHFEFECDTLDARNWCMDFGGLRPLKDKLEEWFDHTLLVAQDDPHRDALINLGKLGIAKITEVERTGCEGLADFLYEYINTIFLPMYGREESRRIWCCRVEVRETDSNMAMRVGHRSDHEYDDFIN
jgi:6-pyruvoyltetrahydropterin/6-carboxytetrahydropterin synthase